MPEDPSPTVASAADDAGSTGSSRESLPSSERPSAEVQSGAVRESEVGSSGTTTGATVASGYRTNPAPEYPMPSRLAGEEGRVELEVVVGTAGAPVSVKLARSSRFPRLDGAALQAVWNWKFRPALREGRPVRASVLVPIRFSLSDS